MIYRFNTHLLYRGRKYFRHTEESFKTYIRRFFKLRGEYTEYIIEYALWSVLNEDNEYINFGKG